ICYLLFAIPRWFSAAPAKALGDSLRIGDARTRPNRLRPRAFSFPQTKTPGESKVAHQISSLDCGKWSTSIHGHQATRQTIARGRRLRRSVHSDASVVAEFPLPPATRSGEEPANTIPGRTVHWARTSGYPPVHKKSPEIDPNVVERYPKSPAACPSPAPSPANLALAPTPLSICEYRQNRCMHPKSRVFRLA